MLQWKQDFDDDGAAVADAPSPAQVNNPVHPGKPGAAAPAPTPTAEPAAILRDPYYRWAVASDWRGLRRFSAKPMPDTLRVIVQGPKDQEKLKALIRDDHWRVPPFYKQPVPGGGGAWARHFTAEIDFAKRDWLEKNEHGLRWELAVPFRDAETAARADRLGEFGQQRELTDFRATKPLPGPPLTLQAVRRGSIPAAIAVIDFGCPFLNERFDHRVAALWDQGSGDDGTTLALPWVPAAGAGYGRELARSSMKAVADATRLAADGRLDECEAYKRIDYLIAYDDPRRRVWGATHGAHVLDVAGGSPDPLTGKADAAGAADLVFVQLPALTASDSSGGSLSAQLLDAVRYVLHVCRDDAPIVVNISYGTFAGPHDGESLIELALQELLEQRSTNFAIVLGAGNAREAGCHVRRTVRKNRSVLLNIDLADGDTTDTFVEIWYQRPPARSPQLHARVRSAQRDWSPWVCPGQQVLLDEASLAEPVAMLRHDAVVPNGGKSLILLALAPTAAPVDDPGPTTPPGRWEVEIELRDNGSLTDDDAVTLDAWIERDDPGDSGAGAQSTFAGTRLDDADNTLSSLATGRHTIVVGGFRRSDGMPTSYSSTGEKGQPNVYAACEEDADQPGILAAAVRSNEVLRMNGTSVAAPVLARRLFNWLKPDGPRGATRDVALNGWGAVLEAIAEHEHETDGNGVPKRARAVRLR